MDPLGTLHGYPSPPKVPQGTLRISKGYPKAIQSSQMDAKTMPPAPKVTKKTSNIMQPPVSRKGPAAGGEALKISAAPVLNWPLGVLDLPSRYPYQGSRRVPPPVLHTTAAGPSTPPQLQKGTWKSSWKNDRQNLQKSSPRSPKGAKPDQKHTQNDTIID